MISIKRLRERVAYDPLTGLFTWITCQYHSWRGRTAGSECQRDGIGLYWHIRIDGEIIKGHRAAWAMTYGKWPPHEIDHINGNGLDNRIVNLRLATHSQNLQNKKVHKNNLTGIKGVHFRKNRNAYIPRIRVNGKLIILGYFKNPKDAETAYIRASKKFWGKYCAALSRGATATRVA